MAPPQTEVASNYSLLLIYLPPKAWKAESAWLADLQRAVYPHKWLPVSCRSSAGQRKFAGQKPTFYHCATQPTTIVLTNRQIHRETDSTENNTTSLHHHSTRRNWKRYSTQRSQEWCRRRPPGLQIYMWPHVTLTFDLLTPKADRFMSLFYAPLLPTGIEISSFVFKILCP